MNFFAPYMTAIKIGAVLILLVAIGAGVLAYNSHERDIGRAEVQQAWDHANVVASAARDARRVVVRQAEVALQEAAEQDRRTRDVENKRMDARLTDNLAGLQQRAERPSPSGPAVVSQPAPSAGAEGGGCTGAGLYRDDAELLTRQADLAQRIRKQRDDYYDQYNRAREKLKALAGQN